jgi:predicted nucleic acid-binding protein
LALPLWHWCQAQPGRHATSAQLRAECQHVLRRPEVRRARAWSDDDIEARLDGLFQHARWLQDPADVAATLAAASHPAPDPGDQFLWNLLAAYPALVLVTRDKRLLKHKRMRGRVWSLGQVVQQLALTNGSAATIPAAPLAGP